MKEKKEGGRKKESRGEKRGEEEKMRRNKINEEEKKRVHSWIRTRDLPLALYTANCLLPQGRIARTIISIANLNDLTVTTLAPPIINGMNHIYESCM